MPKKYWTASRNPRYSDPENEYLSSYKIDEYKTDYVLYAILKNN